MKKTLVERFPQTKLKSRIYPADPPENLPEGSKWLSGHGQGIWFYITKPKQLAEDEFRIMRISLEGEIDCDRVFKAPKEVKFDLNTDYEIAHISHCAKCTIKQNGKTFELEMVRNYKA